MTFSSWCFMRFLLWICIIASWFIIFYEQEIKLFSLSFICFMRFLVLLLLYRNNERKLIGVLFSFVNSSCQDFSHTRKKNFNLFRSYMLDFILLTLKVCRFWSNSWIQQIRYVWLIVKKVWKSSETRQTVVRSMKNMRIDILPLLPARKIPRSSEI